MPESGLFVPIVGASQTKRRGDDRHFQNGKPGKVHPSQTGLLEDYITFFNKYLVTELVSLWAF